MQLIMTIKALAQHNECIPALMLMSTMKEYGSGVVVLRLQQ